MLGERGDPSAVDEQRALCGADLALVAPIDGVVLEQVRQVVRVGDVVDRDEIEPVDVSSRIFSAARPILPSPLIATVGMSNLSLRRQFVRRADRPTWCDTARCARSKNRRWDMLSRFMVESPSAQGCAAWASSAANPCRHELYFGAQSRGRRARVLSAPRRWVKKSDPRAAARPIWPGPRGCASVGERRAIRPGRAATRAPVPARRRRC